MISLKRRSKAALLSLSALVTVGLLGQVPGAQASAGIPVPTLPVGALKYTVKVNKPTGEKGYVFYSTGVAAAAVGLDIPAISPVVGLVQPTTIVIAKKSGEVVWKHTAAKGLGIANFRTQIFHGKKVLTWWEGNDKGGHGSGTIYIANSHYRVIKKITLGGGYDADIHEFRLTPDGRALITSYKEVTRNLKSIGGPSKAKVNDALAFVIDPDTGKVLHKWSALAHIPLTDTRVRRPLPGATSYDPYHINSIDLDPQGDLVMSFRDLSAIWDVDIDTGKTKWVLGGASPTLKAGPGVQFSFQHDAEFISHDVLQLFNDNALGEDDPQKPLALVQGFSSVQRIRIDAKHHTATLVSNWTHPDGIVSIAMGNAQLLPNGDTFVSWGAAPRISEFDKHGKLVYDAIPTSPSYRAFLDTWPS